VFFVFCFSKNTDMWKAFYLRYYANQAHNIEITIPGRKGTIRQLIQRNLQMLNLARTPDAAKQLGNALLKHLKGIQRAQMYQQQGKFPGLEPIMKKHGFNKTRIWEVLSQQRTLPELMSLHAPNPEMQYKWLNSLKEYTQLRLNQNVQTQLQSIQSETTTRDILAQRKIGRLQGIMGPWANPQIYVIPKGIIGFQKEYYKRNQPNRFRVRNKIMLSGQLGHYGLTGRYPVFNKETDPNVVHIPSNYFFIFITICISFLCFSVFLIYFGIVIHLTLNLN